MKRWGTPESVHGCITHAAPKLCSWQIVLICWNESPLPEPVCWNRAGVICVSQGSLDSSPRSLRSGLQRQYASPLALSAQFESQTWLLSCDLCLSPLLALASVPTMGTRACLARWRQNSPTWASRKSHSRKLQIKEKYSNWRGRGGGKKKRYMHWTAGNAALDSLNISPSGICLDDVVPSINKPGFTFVFQQVRVGIIFSSNCTDHVKSYNWSFISCEFKLIIHLGWEGEKTWHLHKSKHTVMSTM